MAATVAAIGNAAVTVVNGILQRQLEDEKSEQTRILEMIKTGDPDKAANNLEFLLKAGLISDPARQAKLREFLATREPGSGPTLPPQTGFGPGPRSIVGADDAVDVNKLPAENPLKKASMAIGQIKAFRIGNDEPIQCTAFLVSDDLVLTASSCIEEANSAKLLMYDGDREVSYEVNLPPREIVSNFYGIDYALLRVNGKPGLKYGTLYLSPEPPTEGQPLSLLMFRASSQKLAVTGTADCRVLKVEKDVFYHLCDTGPGSSGAPVLTADGSRVLGIHFRRGEQGGEAIRVDVLLNASKILQPDR